MKHFSLILFLLCTACHSPSRSPSITSFEKIAMEMKYTILIGETLDSQQKQAAERIIADTFDEIDTVFNNWNPDSEISHLNRLPAGKKVVISEKLATLFRQINQLTLLTNGRFDPTVEPLVQLWKTRLRNGKLPSEEELGKIHPAIGWKKVHIEDGLFWKDHRLTAIDLGGIAKGLCVDLLATRLEKAGYSTLFVEWGGEIRTVGRHPEGRKWNVAIAGITTLEMENQSIATSGDYLQAWTVDGTTYTHIIDPNTKKPLEVTPGSIASATIVAKSCTFADGLATALMLFHSAKEAAELVSALPEVRCWVAEQKGP
ncbi:MAG: FAD:protein FMN transferase [Chlamydiae bacterium]|nr:FAD:protein FMN transferase [Chlamydiota bacterium]